MQLNTLAPALGSKKKAKRVGRGIAAGQGKTCGRGVKGQKARKGGFHKIGFEGGQMPLQRRIPKFGFNSKQKPFVAELTLTQLGKVAAAVVTLEVLKAEGFVRKDMLRVRVIDSGKIDKAVIISGVYATRGAKAAIEAAGGSVQVNE